MVESPDALHPPLLAHGIIEESTILSFHKLKEQGGATCDIARI